MRYVVNETNNSTGESIIIACFKWEGDAKAYCEFMETTSYSYSYYEI